VTPATISIVSHGQAAMVSSLLGNLANQVGAACCRYVVTLNIPESVELVVPAALSDVVILRNATPKGFGENHNAAFEHCIGDWFLVLNPDLTFHQPDTLLTLLAATPTSVDGVLAPQIVDQNGRLADAVRSNLTPWSLLLRILKRDVGRRLSEEGAGSGRFYWFSGMCLVVSATAYRAVGGFDERFFLYCEDYDLCARLYLAGYHLRSISGVRVEHRAQRDSHRKLRWLLWHIQSLMRVWCSPVVWRVCLADYQRK